MRKPVLFGLLATLIVLSIAVYAGSRMGNSETQATPPVVERVTMSKDAAAPVGQAAQTASEAPASGAATPVDGASHSSTSRTSRIAPQIARSASVSLFVDSADSAVNALTQIAHHEGGDVLALQFQNASPEAAAGGTMQIRVPADRFERTINAIDQVGKVRERSITAQDLTGDITDSSARLRNLLRTEDDIRKIMDRGGSVSDIMDVENQLSQVREQIETLESDVKTMHNQVVYSTISVSLSAEGANAPVEPAALAQLGNAWNGAVHALTQTTVSLLATLVWLVVFIPYIAAIAIVVLLIRARLRRNHAGAVSAS